MTEQSEYFKTNDMGLAAYLTLCGHTCQDLEWQGQTCFWKFLMVPNITMLLNLWISKRALVEPTLYNNAFNQVKWEFHHAKRELLSSLQNSED